MHARKQIKGTRDVGFLGVDGGKATAAVCFLRSATTGSRSSFCAPDLEKRPISCASVSSKYGEAFAAQRRNRFAKWPWYRLASSAGTPISSRRPWMEASMRDGLLRGEDEARRRRVARGAVRRIRIEDDGADLVGALEHVKERRADGVLA